jgi:hypothetical protein
MIRPMGAGSERQQLGPIAGNEEARPLDIPYLKGFWSRHVPGSTGQPPNSGNGADWVADNTLLGGLRIGLRETFDYCLQKAPSFEQFEAWILEKNGGALDPGRIQRLNAAMEGRYDAARGTGLNAAEPALTTEDLEFWNANGYVVLHDAVSPEQCQAAAQAIYDFVGMDPIRPDTWYGHSLWIPLLHHPAFWANRDSPRIHRAFAQLWGREDLWPSVDQGGLNPPERPGYCFQGQGLHFDVSLESPIPFGVQGILYLTDTAADQGAFSCVPGFHRVIQTWLNNLPPGADPRQEDLEKLGSIPIPGKAGDLIIWHQALPHGASPNRAAKPRVVQYIAMRPSDWGYNPRWR